MEYLANKLKVALAESINSSGVPVVLIRYILMELLTEVNVLYDETLAKQIQAEEGEITDGRDT